MSRFATLALAAATVGLVSTTGASAAEDDFRDAYIRYSEGGATLQRASEPVAEEAVANLPFLAGDRIWTDARGRVELQFVDGSLVRLDSRSKLDFIARDDGREDRVVLRLWSGALMLRAVGRNAASFAIETPAGLVETSDRAALRVDFEDGEARVSVFQGGANLEGSRGRLVQLEAGERSYLRRGDAPETARDFDRRRGDDFDDWNAERDSREALAEAHRRPLPPEVSPYEGELEANGSWYYMSEVGNVWRPYVAAGWQPYVNGHWDWSSFGWTWVAGESWGWATSHYGRWGYSGGLGWYWIPGSVWSPAWVSWAVSGDYVGWCPLGYGDVPVSMGHGQRAPNGYAVPRGSAGSPPSSWIYARKSDLRAPDVARRRVTLGPADVEALRVASPRGRPTRDLQRIAEGGAASPRTINIKPTMGDFVPELAGDNLTSIPVRAPKQSTRRRDDVSWDRRGTVARPPTAEERRPTDRSNDVSAAPRDQEHRQTEDRRLSEPDREVLRRIFRPVPEARERERTGSDSGHAGSDSGRTAAPRRESPPPAHAAPPPAAHQSAPPPAQVHTSSSNSQPPPKKQN
jgi:hypothetical protein